MATTITALIYSGRPNPSWSLTDEQTQKLENLISNQKNRVKGLSVSHLSLLGYSGFLIHPTATSKIPSTVLVFDGIIDFFGAELRSHLDDEYAIERFLLQTGQSILSEAAAAHIDTELKKNQQNGNGSVVKRFAPLIVPPYDPGKWNNDPVVKSNNNCYNYANNIITNTFAQPGRGSGHRYTEENCSNVGKASVSDGQIALGVPLPPDLPEKGQYIALVIWPGVDYHWYRQYGLKQWAHKPGRTDAINLDSVGHPIRDPQTCDRGPYTDFCEYYHCIPENVTIY